MGRGRGKGKKVTIVATSHENPTSVGEEQLAEYERNGAPEKSMKDDNNQQENVKAQLDGANSKPILTSKEEMVQESGKKRKRFLQAKENSVTVLEESDAIAGFKAGETSNKSIGYRQTRSRRKSKPHRAAEAVVPVMAVYSYNEF